MIGVITGKALYSGAHPVCRGTGTDAAKGRIGDVLFDTLARRTLTTRSGQS
ncbi:MAG: hypothetical protein MZV70_37710 [Desulfobacterales bacterium]|nr:hypothetical protein [Desulfobacterales bacterium]